MKKFKRTRKLVALLLSLSLITGLIPASAISAFAASNTPVDAAIIFADLHSYKTDYKDSILKSVFGALKNTGLPFSSVTSAGDAFSVNEDNSGSRGPYTGLTSKITKSVRDGLGNSTIPVNYVWSDHDRYAVQEDGTTPLSNDSGFVYGAGADNTLGTADDGNYYVYALSMADTSTNNRYNADFHTDAEVTAAITAFSNTVSGLDTKKPLLIAAHQPLFDRRNDNGHAAEWFAAINQAAASRDVAYFFGHNHKYDEASDYYYGKGSTMPVCQKDYSAKNETLNFVHMNAGYLDPATTGSYSNTSRQGTVMAVTIYEDSINYTTYNASGKYTGNYAVDQTVERAFNTTDSGDDTETPGGSETPDDGTQDTPQNNTVTHAATGVTLTAPGLTSVTATKSTENPNTQLYKVYAKYDITPAGYTQGDETTVSIALDDSFSANGHVIVYDIKNGTSSSHYAVNRVVTFTTNHFSEYAVAELRAADSSQAVGTFADPQYTRISSADGLIDGGRYIIVSNTVRNNGGTLTNEKVSGANKLDVIYGINGNYPWYFSSAKNGFYWLNGTTKQWLSVSGNDAFITDSVTNIATIGASPDVDHVGLFLISNGDYYLNKSEANNYATDAGGWTGGYSDNNNLWKLYKIKDVTFSVEETSLEMKTGEELTLNPSVQVEGTAVNGNTLSYASDNTSVATVDANGKVTAVGLGTAYVTVTLSKADNADLASPISQTIEVTVEDPKTQVGRWVTITQPTGGTDGLYATLAGSLTYNAAFGASADSVLAAVKKNLDVYTSSDNSEQASGTRIEDNDTHLTWTLDPNYNATVPGTYMVTIAYDGIPLGIGSVIVPERQIASVTLSNNEGEIEHGGSTVFGAVLQVTYDDSVGTTVNVPITPGMLAGSFNIDEIGTYKGLTIIYNGSTITTDFTLNVVGKIVNDYPEYPNEGAVKVNKTASGIDFQASGVAQVEVSASGIPIKKGADLIVMLDTSSSMNSNQVSGTNYTRLQVLQQSLNNLITQLKTPGDDGEMMDIRLAIADFNGYYDENRGTPYDQHENDYLGRASYDQDANAQIYTGSKALNADAFVQVSSDMTAPTLGYTRGTNYDYGFDAIYQLGTAIKNATEEDRDLYVIFMSDGAAFQWNYYHSRNDVGDWGKWITGQYTTDSEVKSAVNCDTHSYYYDFNDHDGDGQLNEHRMANAIKGNPNSSYEVIRKSTAGLPAGTLTPVQGKDNLYTVPGLGATMFTINFAAGTDGSVQKEDIQKSLASTASEQHGSTKYYYEVTTADQLNEAFNVIGNEVAYAATNARFVDQMGSSFNLQMKTHEYNKQGSNTQKNTITPKIEILSYDIYTKQDAEENKIPNGKQIGDRTGSYQILETVTFNRTGTEAYSNLIDGGKTNILANGSQEGYVAGVIYAKTFIYNTNTTDVVVDGVSIPTGTGRDTTTVLPAETFYWKMGTVQSSELAMRYYVYLAGSMEGEKPAGSYPTNEYAILYYDNYAGNPCEKHTVSPIMPWKSATVSYAFYLVDTDGNIIVNQTTGETGTFANKIALTKPVAYDEVLLNSDGQQQIIDAHAETILPSYYQLYDEQADYRVDINSNATGAWHITYDTSKVQSTYVTDFRPSDPSAYSNVTYNDSTSDDYTHTVVWFAVLWKVEAHPDAVVIDYGLPVDISVLANDTFGSHGKLEAVGPYTAEVEKTAPENTLSGAFSNTYTGTYGTAVANKATGKVRYTPTSMEMNGYDKFAYAVNYNNTEIQGYYYDSVTVIPATTVYYEDDFVEYSSMTWDLAANDWVPKASSQWSVVGERTAASTQAEDRPGQYSLTDANNLYGYDGVNNAMAQYSLGEAMKATVDYDNSAQASFVFWGTGFDVISMTDSTTGTILVDVEKKVDNEWTMFANYAVDTYYGYQQNADGEWVIDPNAEDSLYQIPVIRMTDKDYGNYRVTIKVIYDPMLDHVDPNYVTGSYDFYLDAIRIYDPANDGYADGTTDTTIEDAYVADGEGWPTYQEVRDLLIDAKTFGSILIDNKTINGVVFIDGDEEVGTGQISDYKNYGPNNEVYLAKGQSIIFNLNLGEYADVKDVQIGLKSADGGTVDYSISGKTGTLYTSTSMYYSIYDKANGTIVITNTSAGEGILSVTDIKVTYKENPNQAGQSTVLRSMFRIDRATLAAATEILTEDPKVLYILTDKDAYTVGDTVAVTVKTNCITDYITINGGKITDFDEVDGVRCWYYSQPTDKEETLRYDVTAYNSIGEDVKGNFITVDVKAPAPEPEPEAPAPEPEPEAPAPEPEPEAPAPEPEPEAPAPAPEPEAPAPAPEPEAPAPAPEPEAPAPAPEPEMPAPDDSGEADEPDQIVGEAQVTSIKAEKNTYYAGDTVKVTVITNNDATYVTVNGKKITKFTQVGEQKSWKYTVKTNESGKLKIKAIAYNAIDSESKAKTKTITLKAFAPKSFKVSLNKKIVKAGEKYTVTVKTSIDVKYVIVNGKKITKFTTDKKKKTKTFKVAYTAKEIGKKSIKVVAYSKEGYVSKTKTTKVTVKAFVPKTFKINLSKSNVKLGQKYTVEVKTSTDVKYVTVNGKKITKFTTDKKKTKTFKITYTAKKTGKISIKTVAYSKAGYISKAKSKTVTVKKK